MDRLYEENTLDDKIAQAIISSLSSGAVPVQYVHWYNVGRQQQVETVKGEIGSNRSKLRFVNGDYGSGKTHFLAIIRRWAIENGYVPTHVILSPRGASLYDLRSVYSRIVKNLVHHEQWDISPIQAILELIFQAFQTWLNEEGRRARRRCKISDLPLLYCAHCEETGTIEELYIKDFRKLGVALQTAITVYRTARWGWNPDFETADMVIRWLEGEQLYRRELNYLGVWDHLGNNDIFRGLIEISKLISLIGKKRMIIMLDEAEGIEKLTPYQRPLAYENLQLLINGAYKGDSIYFLYATTPTFFNDVESYSDNLREVIKKTACTELVPLSLSDIERLASKICEIYIASLKGSKTTIAVELITSRVREVIERYNTDSIRSISVRKIVTDLISELQNIVSKQ